MSVFGEFEGFVHVKSSAAESRARWVWFQSSQEEYEGSTERFGHIVGSWGIGDGFKGKKNVFGDALEVTGRRLNDADFD